MSDHIIGMIDGCEETAKAFIAELDAEASWMQLVDETDDRARWFIGSTLTVASDAINAVRETCDEIATLPPDEHFPTTHLGRIPLNIAIYSRGYDRLNVFRVLPDKVRHWEIDLREDEPALVEVIA